MFSKFQCGFRKCYGAHHCLLLKIEKKKKAVDNKKVFGALLTDLPKAFASISHDLLIATLYTHRLSFPAFTAWIVSVFGVFLVPVFPHSDLIQAV